MSTGNPALTNSNFEWITGNQPLIRSMSIQYMEPLQFIGPPEPFIDKIKLIANKICKFFKKVFNW